MIDHSLTLPETIQLINCLSLFWKAIVGNVPTKSRLSRCSEISAEHGMTVGSSKQGDLNNPVVPFKFQKKKNKLIKLTRWCVPWVSHLFFIIFYHLVNRLLVDIEQHHTFLGYHGQTKWLMFQFIFPSSMYFGPVSLHISIVEGPGPCGALRNFPAFGYPNGSSPKLSICGHRDPDNQKRGICWPSFFNAYKNMNDVFFEYFGWAINFLKPRFKWFIYYLYSTVYMARIWTPQWPKNHRSKS